MEREPFLCPLCGSYYYNTINVVFGFTIHECSGCTVLFRDPKQFQERALPKPEEPPVEIKPEDLPPRRIGRTLKRVVRR